MINGWLRLMRVTSDETTNRLSNIFIFLLSKSFMEQTIIPQFYFYVHYLLHFSYVFTTYLLIPTEFKSANCE